LNREIESQQLKNLTQNLIVNWIQNHNYLRCICFIRTMLIHSASCLKLMSIAVAGLSTPLS